MSVGRHVVVAATLTSLVLGGCVGSRRTRYISSGTLVVAGAVMGTASSWHGCTGGTYTDRVSCDIDNQAMGIAGAVVMVLGVVLAVHTTAADIPDEPEPIRITPPPTDELAQLTRQASFAARLGHCSDVHAIASHVEKLDVDYRDHGFAKDTAIAGCLR